MGTTSTRRGALRLGQGVLLLSSCFLLFLGQVRGYAQQARDPEAPARQRLAWMPTNQPGMLNVDENEGAFLRDQVIKVKAKCALDVGTSNGYSSLWIALGLHQTGGHLTTLEIDDPKVKLPRENFRLAGLEPLITLTLSKRSRDSKARLTSFSSHAWKHDYVKYLDMVLPLVPPAESSWRTTLPIKGKKCGTSSGGSRRTAALGHLCQSRPGRVLGKHQAYQGAAPGLAVTGEHTRELKSPAPEGSFNSG